MADINVRVGQSEAIKVLTTGGGGSLVVPKNVVGGIADITALNVSGLSTFIGVSTFHNHVYSQRSFKGLSFEGISGITTIGSLSGITTTLGDLYVGGSLKIFGNASGSFGSLNVAGIITGGNVTTSEWETNSGEAVDLFTGITLWPGSGGDSGIATITSPNTLVIRPRHISADPAQDTGQTGAIGKVYIDGDLQVTGSTITESTQIIEIGDYRVSVASTIQDNAILNGAGIGIGSTSQSGIPIAIEVYTGGIGTGGTGYNDVGTAVTVTDGSGSWLQVDYIASGGVIGTVSVSAASTGKYYEINDQVIVPGGDGFDGTLAALLITDTENSDYSQKLFYYDNSNNTLSSNIGLGIGSNTALKTGTDVLLNKTTLGPTVVGSSLTTIGTTLYQNLTISGILSSTGGIDGGSY